MFLKHTASSYLLSKQDAHMDVPAWQQYVCVPLLKFLVHW